MAMNVYILDDQLYKIAWIPDLLTALNGPGTDFCFGFAKQFSACPDWLERGYLWYLDSVKFPNQKQEFERANISLFSSEVLSPAIRDDSSIWLIDLKFSRLLKHCDIDALYNDLVKQFELSCDEEDNVKERALTLLGQNDGGDFLLGALIIFIRERLSLPYFVVSEAANFAVVDTAGLPGLGWPDRSTTAKTYSFKVSSLIEPAAEKIKHCARTYCEDLIQALTYVGAIGISQKANDFGHVEWSCIKEAIDKNKGSMPFVFPLRLQKILTAVPNGKSTATSKALFCRRSGTATFNETACCRVPRESADRMPVETFQAILALFAIKCSHTGFIGANGQVFRHLCLPSSPGVLFIIRLIEFLHNELKVWDCSLSVVEEIGKGDVLPVALRIPILQAWHFQAAFYTRLPEEKGGAVISFRRLLACRGLSKEELEGVRGQLNKFGCEDGWRNHFESAITSIEGWQTDEMNKQTYDGHRPVLYPVVRHVFHPDSVNIVWDGGAPKVGRGIE